MDFARLKLFYISFPVDGLMPYSRLIKNIGAIISEIIDRIIDISDFEVFDDLVVCINGEEYGHGRLRSRMEGELKLDHGELAEDSLVTSE